MEVLRLASQEAEEWFQANFCSEDNCTGNLNVSSLIWSEVARPMAIERGFTEYRCFVDGSWRESDTVSGIGWFCFPDSVDGEMYVSKAIPKSLSPLHAETEAVLWAMKCLSSLGTREVSLATNCSMIMKMISSPQDWPAFTHFLRNFKD